MSEFELKLLKANSLEDRAKLLAEFEKFKAFITAALNRLQEDVDQLTTLIESAEMSSRRKILMFHGILENDDDKITDVILGLLSRYLNINLSIEDVERCHRIGEIINKKPRPVIIKFKNVAVRDSVWYSKNSLKSSGVILSEFLTQGRHQLYVVARKIFGKRNCWTTDGRVFIKGKDGTRYSVASLSDLDIVSDYQQEADKQSKSSDATVSVAVDTKADD